MLGGTVVVVASTRAMARNSERPGSPKQLLLSERRLPLTQRAVEMLALNSASNAQLLVRPHEQVPAECLLLYRGEAHAPKQIAECVCGEPVRTRLAEQRREQPSARPT